MTYQSIGKNLLVGLVAGILSLLFPASVSAQFGFGNLGLLNDNGTTTDTPGNDLDVYIGNDGNDVMIAAWSSEETLAGSIGTDRDILYAVSNDGGQTWGTTTELNDNAGSDSGLDLAPTVVSNGDGRWIAAWITLDTLGGTIGGDPDLLYSISDDDGASWSPPAALNNNAGSDSGQDSFQSMDVFEDGASTIWIAVFESDENISGSGTDFDIAFVRSIDNGASWSAPATIHADANIDSGADVRPQIRYSVTDRWICVYGTTDDKGGTIGSDLDLMIVTSTSGSGAAWNTQAVLNDNAAIDSGEDRRPWIETDNNGNWIIVWDSTEPSIGAGIGADSDILYITSSNDGTTWTSPAALNSNAGSDTGDDITPRIITDDGGNWVVVWESTEASVGSGIGADSDILISRSTDNGATWSAVQSLNSNAGGDSEDDIVATVQVSGSGDWVAAWGSEEDDFSAGTDFDIFTMYSTSIPVELSAFDVE
jgi:Neuraminidase (sialidase)